MEEYTAKHPLGCPACVGIFLFSRIVTNQVSSAPLSLTSVFGMGTGGPSTSSTPTLYGLVLPYFFILFSFLSFGDSCGNRTRVTGVRGRCLNRLTNEPFCRRLVQGSSPPSAYPLGSWCTIRDSNPGHPD